MNTAIEYQTIAELLACEINCEDMNWLRRCLQMAVELEMATLPPYLCARWSIAEDGNSTARARMRSITRDEMDHLGAVANMLVGIGFAPQLRDTPEHRVVPVFPGKLPGGVHEDLCVDLGPLNKKQLETFMTIEEPEEEIPSFADAERVTIGMFYKRLTEGFIRLAPPISLDGQVRSAPTFADLASVVAGIDKIAREGEGYSDSPHYKGKLTHHYVFGEIYHRKAFIEREDNPGHWWYIGDEVPFPARVRALTGPAAETDADNLAFNTKYSEMLFHLHDAWNGGPEDSFSKSVSAMYGLESLAVTVMERRLWPTFSYVGSDKFTSQEARQARGGSDV